ncbi:microviridin/marinostatin family tricyclic proteinase inhibitor [Vibrio sp. S9_S30]|uniref:microviridin/marinostatin family tricyclic proteinase inhibitor n=1 Tax=Vibrio sp. S9_S30 TaxID=2720226 RepID=UPI0016809D70|nr:microviridin/marinostatin family tricyclic proteinase inhibitor [Vibrio sp. S9_S30]
MAPFFSYFIESQIDGLNDAKTTQCSGSFTSFNVSMTYPSDGDKGIEIKFDP